MTKPVENEEEKHLILNRFPVRDQAMLVEKLNRYFAEYTTSEERRDIRLAFFNWFGEEETLLCFSSFKRVKQAAYDPNIIVEFGNETNAVLSLLTEYWIAAASGRTQTAFEWFKIEKCNSCSEEGLANRFLCGILKDICYGILKLKSKLAKTAQKTVEFPHTVSDENTLDEETYLAYAQEIKNDPYTAEADITVLEEFLPLIDSFYTAYPKLKTDLFRMLLTEELLRVLHNTEVKNMTYPGEFSLIHHIDRHFLDFLLQKRCRTYFDIANTKRISYFALFGENRVVKTSREAWREEIDIVPIDYKIYEKYWQAKKLNGYADSTVSKYRKILSDLLKQFVGRY